MNEAWVGEAQARRADPRFAQSARADTRIAYGFPADHAATLGIEETVSSRTPPCGRPSTRTVRVRFELARAWAMLIRLDADEALAVVQRIERQIAALPGPDVLAVLSEVAAMRAAALLLQDDGAAALPAALSALRLDAHAPTAHVARTVCRYVYWQLGDVDGLDAFARCEPGERADRLRTATAVFDRTLDAMLELSRSHLNTARTLADDALELAGQLAGDASALEALPASVAAQVLYEQGCLDEAQALIASRLPSLRESGTIEGALRCYGVLARIAAARGLPGHALVLLAEADALGLRRRWPRLRAAAIAQQIELHIAARSFDAAEVCLRTLAALAAESTAPGYPPRFEIARYHATAQARLALAQGRDATGLSELQWLLEDSMQRRDPLSAVSIELLLVEAMLNAQRYDDAFDRLVALMRRAVSIGLLQTLVDCSDGVSALIESVIETGVRASHDIRDLQPYASAILARRARIRHAIRADLKTSDETSAHAAPVAMAQLSDRERTVVALMGQGMTNKQIAIRLCIAPETVKSHAKHVYTKLAVRNRTEAATLAGRLGLVERVEA
ncbi:LuxR C-terminal-related transcriptional regulator [Pararobbsia silviterrae]|uniref:HTH luxR-type domain-containing protein n=1 Tax=Pararobbsia silviterrae TaxID=1792498 RepID=A0A494X8U2_9BURK|nr:LuxR C-terminal-related transcriptional regulator [Pararobbsia silviterrae]RKP47135.1 hypothetical protein D7S86_23625 [Pararobbsia silviterrae]